MNIEVNLLGIRNKTLLCRTKAIKGIYNHIIKGITEEEEKYIDDNESFKDDDNIINKGDIICYGAINLNSDTDYDFIENLKCIADNDEGNMMPTKIDWHKGCALVEEGSKIKYAPTWDIMKWFEYNYMLIGRPERIIIYKKKICITVM